MGKTGSRFYPPPAPTRPADPAHPAPTALPAPPALSRRDFLSGALLIPAFARQLPLGARLLGTLPLGAPGGAAPPFGRLLGAGLDARLFTDLSMLGESAADTFPAIPNPAIPNPETRNPAIRNPAIRNPAIRNPQSAIRDSPVTPNERFFIRTACPATLPSTDNWTIGIGGLVRSPRGLKLNDLEPQIGPGGRYLIECSGNADQTNYGLMSVADWDGVRFSAVLDSLRASSASSRVMVSGVDDERMPSRTSVPGASWIFSRDDLQHALLAVRMNGAPLPRDHGAPIRLVVPGWYGCACIKWVDRIELVADDAAATTQMREFGARTHQDPRASLARDFTPAVIDTAAMPLRVEKWLIDGRLAYRVAGIVWGGSKATSALSIRFRSGQPWVRVDDCPTPASTLTWSVWSHMWRPDAPGRYQLVLRVDDPTIRTRRLDIFFYVREVDVDEV